MPQREAILRAVAAVAPDRLDAVAALLQQAAPTRRRKSGVLVSVRRDEALTEAWRQEQALKAAVRELERRELQQRESGRVTIFVYGERQRFRSIPVPTRRHPVPAVLAGKMRAGKARIVKYVITLDGNNELRIYDVSIPSRRVGDPSQIAELRRLFGGFHPLKAGRRQGKGKGKVKGKGSFHPLKAGRRLVLRVFKLAGFGGVSIPSRRVGDRPKEGLFCHDLSRFPSPQGGSETDGKEGKADGAADVSIPSRRVGDFCIGRSVLDGFGVSIPSRRVGDQGKMRGKAGKRRQKGGRVAVDLR